MTYLNTFFNVLAKEADEIQLKIKDFKKNQVQMKNTSFDKNEKTLAQILQG